MGLLARRNLFHDRVRFAVTLTSIVFALLLIIIQFELFLGFTTAKQDHIWSHIYGPYLIQCPYIIILS